MITITHTHADGTLVHGAKGQPMSTYEPAMMQPLRLKTTRAELWMIYAADGTVLDAIDTSDGVRPVWAEALTRLTQIDVMPSEWRYFRDNCRAMRA